MKYSLTRREWTLLGIYVGRAADAPAPKLVHRQWLGRLRGCVDCRALDDQQKTNCVLHRPAV